MLTSQILKARSPSSLRLTVKAAGGARDARARAARMVRELHLDPFADPVPANALGGPFMRSLLCFAFLIMASPAFAEQTRDEWEPIRLPPSTQVSVSTPKAIINIATMAKFYNAAKISKSDCKIKTQGSQYIICINRLGDIVFEISYDSIGEVVSIFKARLKLHKSGTDYYEGSSLVDMVREFLE